MASYIHYEKYCNICRKYFTKKYKVCSKCGAALENINKWYITFRCVELGKEKQKKLGAFDTKKEAEEAYQEYCFRPKLAIINVSVDELVREMEESIKAQNKPSTLFNFRNAYNRLPQIHKLQVRNIKRTDLIKLYDNLKKSDYAQNTKHNTWRVLGQILSYASLEKGIDGPHHEYQKIKRISRGQVKKDAWTKEHWTKFITTVYDTLASAKNEPQSKSRDNLRTCSYSRHYVFYVLFNWLFYMGNRRGEAMAVKVGKIDFEKKTVLIDENISYKVMSKEREKGKVFVLTDRKNHKPLLETIPDKLVTLLKDYIEYFGLKENDLLFFKKSPIPPETLRRKFDEYIELAGVPRITPHQFRHTLASVIFASGNSKIEDAYVVAQRLGHNVKYTLDTYGSLFKEREIDIMNNLDL